MKRSTSLSIAASATILGFSSFAAAQYPQQPGYAPQYPQQPGYAPQYGYSAPPAYGYGAPPAPTFVSEAMQSRVALQVDWFNSAPKTSPFATNVFTWDLAAQIAVTKGIVVDVDIPWSYVAVSGGTASKPILGLPILGAHLAARFSPTGAFFVGMAIGIPVQGTMQRRAQFAAAFAGSLRGYQEIHRFYPNQMPLRFRGGIEIEAKPFYLQADLAPAFLISLDSNQDTIVTLDQGTNVGVRTSFGLIAGLRLQESFFLTTANDRVQTAIEPFVGYESPGKTGLIARYGLLMPLDGEQGFAFDAGKLLTNRFSVGAKF